MGLEAFGAKKTVLELKKTGRNIPPISRNLPVSHVQSANLPLEVFLWHLFSASVVLRQGDEASTDEVQLVDVIPAAPGDRVNRAVIPGFFACIDPLLSTVLFQVHLVVASKPSRQRWQLNEHRQWIRYQFAGLFSGDQTTDVRISGDHRDELFDEHLLHVAFLHVLLKPLLEYTIGPLIILCLLCLPFLLEACKYIS